MLKTRIVGLLPIRQGIVVQSIGFRRYLPVGRPEVAVEYLNNWGIDEIVMVDMDATRQGAAPDHGRVERCARFCQVPLTVGGGIAEVGHIERIVKAGADKISLNAAVVEAPGLIAEGARSFGRQCIVVSIDARRDDKGGYEAFTHGGTRATGSAPWQLAAMAEESGAGEILVTSIDQDGSRQGYDLELVRRVREAVSIPVIACGGAGRAAHMLECVRLGVDAVAAGNFFNYTEMSVIQVKRYLKDAGASVRLDSYATFEGFTFAGRERIGKRDDAYLERMRFEYVPQEVI